MSGTRVLFAVGLSLSLAFIGQQTHGGEFINGTDISALTVLEDMGATYSDGGVTGDAIDILEDNGVNWHRLRIFVDPTGSDPVAVQDLAYTIELAKRAKANGSRLLLDFHYSDTWADPGKQFKPSAWNSLSFSQLEQQVYDYTKDVIEEFKSEGVLPEMVQIGNEISNGTLWSDGQLWKSGVPEGVEFDDLATLLSAGINGAKDGAGAGHEPLIMIHHDKGGDMGATSYYFDRLLPRLESNGTDVDVIGYSYYPLHHYEPDDCDPNNRGCGSMKDVRENLIYTATEFKLPVALVEVGFASRDEPGADYEFEVSQQGQKDFLEATVDALKAVPNDMGWGLFWWYAEAVPVDDFGTVWKYGSYGLFDKGVNWPDYNPDSEALPAQEVFAEIAAEFSALPGDFDFDVDVDGADFLILQAQFGSTGLLAADADGDFRVNSEDLEVWESQYGETSLTAALATVPEPTGLLLFGTFLVWNQVLGPRSLRSRG